MPGMDKRKNANRNPAKYRWWTFFVAAYVLCPVWIILAGNGPSFLGLRARTFAPLGYVMTLYLCVYYGSPAVAWLAESVNRLNRSRRLVIAGIIAVTTLMVYLMTAPIADVLLRHAASKKAIPLVNYADIEASLNAAFAPAWLYASSGIPGSDTYESYCQEIWWQGNRALGARRNSPPPMLKRGW
jgi:hypothetical protein